MLWPRVIFTRYRQPWVNMARSQVINNRSNSWGDAGDAPGYGEGGRWPKKGGKAALLAKYLVIPEPSSLLLGTVALAGVVAWRGRWETESQID